MVAGNVLLADDEALNIAAVVIVVVDVQLAVREVPPPPGIRINPARRPAGQTNKVNTIRQSAVEPVSGLRSLVSSL